MEETNDYTSKSYIKKSLWDIFILYFLDIIAWPALPLAEWKDAYDTLHRWTQIIGKIKLTPTPLMNYWWNVTLYVTPRGFTISPIPYND